MSIICLTLQHQVDHSTQDISQSLLVMQTQVLLCTGMTYPQNWNERIHKKRAGASSAKQNLICKTEPYMQPRPRAAQLYWF